MNTELIQYFKQLDQLAELTNKLPNKLSRVAVNFSKERFLQQNWVDNNTEQWAKRKPVKNETKRRSKRGILINTGLLRNSIRVVYVDRNIAIIGTDVAYAKAHNYGFRGAIKQSVKAHKRTTRSGRVAKVKKHKRTINTNLPRRQFIGDSAVLRNRLTRYITAEFIRTLKKN